MPQQKTNIDISSSQVSINYQKENQKTQLRKTNMLPYEESDLLIELDMDGVITYANPAAQLLLGNWGSDITNSVKNYPVGDHAPQILQDASFEAFTRQISKSIEIRFGEKTYLFFLMPLTLIGFVHLHGIDITERKRGDNVLTWTEENHRRLFEEITDAVFLSNPETGIIIDCNLAATQLMDLPRAKLIGMNRRFLHPQKECAGFLNVKSNEGFSIRFEIINNNGITKNVNVKSKIIEVNGKNLVQDIFRDVTAQRQMEKRLRELAYKLTGLSSGDCFICESHERFFKAYVDLTKYGVSGLCIIRDDPKRIVTEYGINTEEVKLLSSKPIENFQTLPDLQAISLAISEILKKNASCVVLLDGLEYLIARFGFESVYRLIQEKRFDFLENEALLLMPINLGTLGEREKALLASETKILLSKSD